MMLPQTLKSFINLLLTFGLFKSALPVEVKIGETAMFTCNDTCSGPLLWTFKTDNENLDILKCDQNACTEGDSFKDRVSLKTSTLSLTLHPVLYNDEGWYMVFCDSTFLFRFYLKVLVPTTVSASVRSNVTLHCYARTEKQIADNNVNILWIKDDQTVLHVQKGITTYGSGFKGRASVSLPHYKTGDLSLNILGVTTSDNGFYRCYHRDTEEHGNPGSVNLNVTADQKMHAQKTGDNLMLDLFGSVYVKVTFIGQDAVETFVCNVTANNTTCSSDYSHRVSVQKGFLVVQGVTSSDTGKFIVRDMIGEVIGVNTVTVEGVTQRRHHFITVCLLIVFLLICICIVCCQCHGQSQTRQYHCRYNAVESNVDINTETLREPACIGLSQQETNPEPEVLPRTPVEETMPGTVRTTEKQDNTEEYITTGNGLKETL